MTKGKQLFSAADIDGAVGKIASGIGDEFKGDFRECALVGIHQQGVPLAERICRALEKKFGSAPVLGKLDISMYRDDIGNRMRLPPIRETEIPFDVNGKVIILVDDVIYTGRTARAAMDALIERGRPAVIRLCAIVDRGHRELPIAANYVGKNVPTSREEFISVRVKEIDGINEIVLNRIKDVKQS